LEKSPFSTPQTPKIKRRRYAGSAFRCFPSHFRLAFKFAPRSFHSKLPSPNSCDLQVPRHRRYQISSLSYSLRNPRRTSIIHLQRASRAPNKSPPHRMAKVIQQLSTPLKTSPMKQLIALLSYLHFATLQVPQHHTHHIGRIVQPQIRLLSAALQGGVLRSPSAKSAGQKSQSGSAQTATP